MSISKATLADIPELNLLVNSAYRGDSSKKGWTTEADLLGGIRTDDESLASLLNKENSVMLVHRNDEGKIIGCVNLQRNGDKVYLGMLTVNPELQGGGVGKILLKASDDYAKETGCPKLFMTVISIRTELIDWYKRHGYKETGERKPFPMDDPKFGLPKVPLEFIVLEKEV
ncbi:MAG: GNAT family N-acetyltransferase [Sphingobacteriales bacterium]|nr:GNAT family N-acetyltransferase [Sphingobacteriales bacterium]MBI3719018.1 GNAT family N-acetyltransferase [Sphingobacteriales bacterium]